MINLPGGMHAMTMHDGEGHALTGATAEARDFFEHALAYIRGYRIKACLVAQSLNQLVQTYGENSSILDNAHVRVAFACNDERTARRISDMLGVTTETRAQMNYAGSRMAPWLGHTMVSRQEVPRPLLTPGEVMQLPHADALILTGGAPPIRAKKVRYFSEPVFQARLLPPYASPRHSANGLPTAWSNLFAPDTPLSPPPKPTAAKRTSAPTHGQNHQALQNTFDFSTPVSGEAAQTNTTASQSAANPSDDLGAAFTGPTLAGTVFALDPDHFDTDV